MTSSTLAARVAFHEIPGLRASLLVLIVGSSSLWLVVRLVVLARSLALTLLTAWDRVGGAEHIEDVTVVT